jgi:hypothetical protein
MRFSLNHVGTWMRGCRKEEAPEVKIARSVSVPKSKTNFVIHSALL